MVKPILATMDTEPHEREQSDGDHTYTLMHTHTHTHTSRHVCARKWDALFLGCTQKHVFHLGAF